MTADGVERSDTTCPSCEGPVGTRATYCMHCGRDIPDRTDYDDVTGQSETDARGKSLLSRLRPGKRTDRESIADAGTPAVVDSSTGTIDDGTIDAGAFNDDTFDDGTFDTGAADDGFRTDEDRSARGSRVSVPSGRGTDGPTLLPTDGVFDESNAAAKMLGVLGLLGAAGVLGLDLSLPLIGAVLAVLAWTTSIVAIARRHSGFDAMRYGSYSLMILLIFVSFGFAFSSVGGGLFGFGLTMVPVAIAALFVAGFGYSIDEYTPE